MFYDLRAKYKSYLPELFDEVLEINVIDHCVNVQVDNLSNRIKDAINNKFVATANEEGLLRWEKILGVNSPLNSSITARREALKARLMTKPPINLTTLRSVIEAYMGVKVDIDIQNYMVTVWYRGEIRVADLSPLYATVYEMIPANLVLEILYRYLIWDELDSLHLNFTELDAEMLVWDEFERGDWIAE